MKIKSRLPPVGGYHNGCEKYQKVRGKKHWTDIVSGRRGVREKEGGCKSKIARVLGEVVTQKPKKKLSLKSGEEGTEQKA